MALPMVPYADAGPLYGFVLPILISVAVTPTTVWAGAAEASPKATRAPASTAAVNFRPIISSPLVLVSEMGTALGAARRRLHLLASGKLARRPGRSRAA